MLTTCTSVHAKGWHLRAWCAGVVGGGRGSITCTLGLELELALRRTQLKGAFRGSFLGSGEDTSISCPLCCFSPGMSLLLPTAWSRLDLQWAGISSYRRTNSDDHLLIFSPHHTLVHHCSPEAKCPDSYQPASCPE